MPARVEADRSAGFIVRISIRARGTSCNVSAHRTADIWRARGALHCLELNGIGDVYVQWEAASSEVSDVAVMGLSFIADEAVMAESRQSRMTVGMDALHREGHASDGRVQHRPAARRHV